MSLLPERFIGRDLVRFNDHNSVSKRRLFKSEIATLSIWLGQRDLANQDLETFYHVSSMCRFRPYVTFDVLEANEVEDPHLMQPVIKDLIPNLDRIDLPLAVFAIMTAAVAEKPWSKRLCEGILQYRWQARQMTDTAVYRIVMQGGFDRKVFWPYYERFYNRCDQGEEPRFWPEEEIAQELGAFFLFYNSDAPTAGCMRLVDFMRRILGRDLPGVEFPGYSFEEISKIAWHVNRESYNMGGVKPGSIPKYQISEDGRPIFPF